MGTVREWATRVGALAACALFALLPACSSYAQDTPDSVIASAKQMVKEGHAERLTDLIYADTPEMRALLDKLGEVLGTLQDLGKEVQKRFPAELAELSKQAEETAKKGQAGNALNRIASQAFGGARRAGRAPGDGDEMREGLNRLAKEIFSDPYGWLERTEGGISVSRENQPDDMAQVQWGGKPILGVGLSLKQQDGSWYFLLPIPPTMMPKSADTWEIVGAGLDVVDQMLLDLKKDVASGKIARLEDLANSAGQKVVVPAMLIILAFEKAKEAEKKAAKPAATAPTGTPPPK